MRRFPLPTPEIRDASHLLSLLASTSNDSLTFLGRLISSGLIKVRHMTSYKTIVDDLKNAGANWVDDVCVRDRNWVSSRQPSDIPQFNKNMIELFSEHRQKQTHKAA